MPVLAYHVVFGAYGQWLPNDPRGSGSTFVGSKRIRQFGPATGLTDRRRSVANQPHDIQLRLAAKSGLDRPAVRFTGHQALAIGRGFASYVQHSSLVIWACAIMPDHVHLVIARHSYKIEQVVVLLISASTEQLIGEGLHPFADRTTPDGRVPHCWAEGQWKVFLNTDDDIRRAIAYVEDNPEKAGLRRQKWSFVTKYEGLQ